MDTIRNEPVLVSKAISAVGLALISFGVDITADQLTYLGLAWIAVSALWVRSKVSPV
jgi:hypothetical protein